jgi:hypothetical protein
MYKFGDKIINPLFKLTLMNQYYINSNVKRHMSKAIDDFMVNSRCKIDPEQIINEIIPDTINQAAKILIDKINLTTNNNPFRISNFIILLNVFRMYQMSSKREEFASIINKIGSYLSVQDLTVPSGTNGSLTIDDADPLIYDKNGKIDHAIVIKTVKSNKNFAFNKVDKMILIKIKSENKSLQFKVVDTLEIKTDQTGEDEQANETEPDNNE